MNIEDFNKFQDYITNEEQYVDFMRHTICEILQNIMYISWLSLIKNNPNYKDIKCGSTDLFRNYSITVEDWCTYTVFIENPPEK